MMKLWRIFTFTQSCEWCWNTLNAHLFTGGAISNMYSVMVARYKYFPEVKTKGMSAAPRLVLFTSEHVSSLHIRQSNRGDLSPSGGHTFIFVV